MNNNIIYQNYAYCRIIHIWSHLITIYILFILHNISFLINKTLGIQIFDIFLIILHYFKISPIKLHTKYLLKDDKIYKNETYFEYKKRIWKLFLITPTNI